MVDTTLLVALGGGAGVALIIREVVSVVAALRQGVSAKEGKRKTDIVQQRDEAIDDARVAKLARVAAENRADEESEKRRSWQEIAARYKRLLLLNGIDTQDDPDSDIEITMPGHPPFAT